MSGCKTCKMRYTRAGDAMCRYEPHDFSTPMQQAISRWLTATELPWHDDGCPGYTDEPECAMATDDCRTTDRPCPGGSNSGMCVGGSNL